MGQRLVDAGSDLDQIGNDTPSGDYGIAAALIESILGSCADAATDLVVEATVVGETVIGCADTSSTADQAAAESFMVTGTSDD